MAKCGYCDLELKDENLTAHFQNLHKKPRLAKGQKMLTSLFQQSRKDEAESHHIDPNQGKSTEEPPEKRGRYATEPTAISGEIEIDDKGSMGDMFVEQVERLKILHLNRQLLNKSRI